jgi:peptide/nickel transport system ATP-binding protein
MLREATPNQQTKRAAHLRTGIETLLEVRNLSVEYQAPEGAVRAVDGISFDIAPGEVFGLAGESGCGKSTVALALLRLLGPPAIITSGDVHFRDRDILAMSDSQL